MDDATERNRYYNQGPHDQRFGAQQNEFLEKGPECKGSSATDTILDTIYFLAMGSKQRQCEAVRVSCDSDCSTQLLGGIVIEVLWQGTGVQGF
jgi:hypothetical protein